MWAQQVSGSAYLLQLSEAEDLFWVVLAAANMSNPILPGSGLQEICIAWRWQPVVTLVSPTYALTVLHRENIGRTASEESSSSAPACV